MLYNDKNKIDIPANKSEILSKNIKKTKSKVDSTPTEQAFLSQNQQRFTASLSWPTWFQDCKKLIYEIYGPEIFERWDRKNDDQLHELWEQKRPVDIDLIRLLNLDNFKK